MISKLHGWPDLSIGWRYQIPVLIEMGYRVVCPDLMGYGGTDSPRVPPESIINYTYKRAAEDFKQLASDLGAKKIILGGHDWGAAIAYRFALWFPELVTHLFTLCVPFFAPVKVFKPVGDLARTRMPNWGYQVQLARGIVEQRVRSKAEIKQFLSAVYGGRTQKGKLGFDVRTGVIFENLSEIRMTRLMDEKTMNFYVEQYKKTGLHQTKCWYSSLEQNFKDELSLQRKTIDVPLLFIQATKDTALPPTLSEGMEGNCSKLTRKSVATSHWALWEAPVEVNNYIKEWLELVDTPTSNL